MSHWYVLKIEKTDDKNAVKAAYMALLPSYNPEDDPQGFTSLRTAYEEALKEIDQAGNTKTENDPVSIFFAELRGLYGDFAQRINPAQWEEALKSDVCTALDTEEEVDVKMLEFLAKKHNMPTDVWAVLNSRFRWTERAGDLRKRYSPGLINSIVSTVNSKFNLNYQLFEYEPGADIDRYIYQRNALTAAIDNRNKEEADKLIEELKAQSVHHPILDIEIARYMTISGNKDEALSTINAVLSKHTVFETEPFALYVKATALLSFDESEKLAEALDTYYKAIEIVPNYYFAQLGVVDVLVKQEEYDKADKYLTDVMMLENPSTEYLYRYYDHIAGLKLKKYEALYEETPSQEIAENLALCYSTNNQHEKCIELLQDMEKTAWVCDLLGYSYNVQKEYNLAIEYALKAIAIEPKYKSYFLLSGIYLAKRYYEKTIENADSAINLNLPEEGTNILGKAKLISDKAYAYMKLGKFNQALETVEEAMAISTKMSDVYADKAEILTHMNKLSEAYAEAEKAINLTPNWTRPYEIMAEIFYRAGKFDQMAEVFNKAEEKEFKSHGLTYFKGCRAGALKEYDQCNEILKNLLEEENLGTWEDKALDALCYYNRQAKNHENVVTYAEKLIEFYEKNEFAPVAIAYTYLATAHKTLENPDKQLEALKQGLIAMPNNEKLLTELGYHLDDIKSPDALDNWKLLMEIAPKNAIPYNRIAILLGRDDKYQEALDILNQGLDEIPGNLNLLGRRAYIYSDMEEYDKAIEDCLQVAENPQKQYTWWSKGSMYFEIAWTYWSSLNDEESATKYFALTEENNGFTTNWRKSIYAGYFEWKKDYDKAIEIYNQCIDGDQKDEYAFLSRGGLYKLKGDTAKSEEDLNKALEMVANAENLTHDLYRIAGTAYLQMGNKDKAREYFEKCEEAVKTDGTKNGECHCVYRNWAEYYKHTGEYVKALEQIKLVVALANSVRNNGFMREIEALLLK